MEDSVRSRSYPYRLRRAAVAGLLVVSTVAGCSNYIGTTAASFLRKVREDPDPNIRYLAYMKLAAPACYDSPRQRSEAVQLLIERLKKGREPVASRAVICRTLGALGDPAAREVVLKAVSDPEGAVRVEACRALGKVGRTEDATVLTRVMTVDTLEDCRIAAIESLAELKPDDPRIARVLLVSLQHDDPATRFASLNALRQITGRDLGVDPGPWQKLLEGEKPETAIAAATPSADAPDQPASPAQAPTSAPMAPPQVAAAVPAAPPSYPPRPVPRPDPSIDSSTEPVSYPPTPRTYLPR